MDAVFGHVGVDRARSFPRFSRRGHQLPGSDSVSLIHRATVLFRQSVTNWSVTETLFIKQNVLVLVNIRNIN